MKRDLPSECGNCGIEESWLLHHVFIRNNHSRVCTSCVLKLHSGSFCPICFEVYEEGKHPDNRVLCMRCPSVTHPNCVSKDVISSFICPTCSNPNFTFFESSKKLVSGNNNDSIDENMGKILAAAAQIGYISMSKAATGVKMEADRKVKEASLKRKEAKEALNRIHALFAEKKARGNIVVGKNPVPIIMMEEKKATKGNNANNANIVINTNNALSAAVAAQQRLEKKSSIEPIMKSAVRVAVPSNNFGSARILERPQTQTQTQNPSTIEKNKNTNPGYLPPLQTNVVSMEKEKNGIFSQSGKLQRLHIGPDTEVQGSLKGCTGSGISRQVILPKKDSFVNSSNEGARLAPSNTTS